MQQMKLYTCYLTEKGDIVVVIPFINGEKTEQAKLFYAGGEHAIFCKTSKQKIILDYLNTLIRPVLKKADKVLLFEMDITTQKIVRDYFVPVEHLDKLPEFSLELKAN